jgi:hypothetical protein
MGKKDAEMKNINLLNNHWNKVGLFAAQGWTGKALADTNTLRIWKTATPTQTTASSNEASKWNIPS